MLEVLLLSFGGGESFGVWGGGGMETGVVVVQAGALCSSVLSPLSSVTRACGGILLLSLKPLRVLSCPGEIHIHPFSLGILLGSMGSPFPGTPSLQGLSKGSSRSLGQHQEAPNHL